MSHSTGAIRFSDGLIMFCEYNGTVDVMLSNLYNTYEEMHDMWRKQEWKMHDKSCNKDEEVEIASSYGRGFSWTGRACKECMIITDYHSIDDYKERNHKYGLPEWFPNRAAYEF